MYYGRQKAESEAQRGKPKGIRDRLLTKFRGGDTTGCVYYEREKAESEAQRGEPRGTLESEIRIAISLLGQRPPRYSGVGRSCSIAAEAISWERCLRVFMRLRSNTGAGRPVTMIMTRMATACVM